MLFASRVARRTKSRTSLQPPQNLPKPTGLWRVAGAHVAAMGASFGDRVGGAVSLHSLTASRLGRKRRKVLRDADARTLTPTERER